MAPFLPLVCSVVVRVVWSVIGRNLSVLKTAPKLLLGIHRTPILATRVVAKLASPLAFTSVTRRWNPFSLLKLIRPFLARVLSRPLIAVARMVIILV